jgi:hypothetical protein
MNTYINFLYQKRSLWTRAGRKNRRSMKKFMRLSKQTSPSFDNLWEIAEFIKLLEYTFFYKNEPMEMGLYSSPNGYKDGTNGFTVTTPEVSIKLKLYLENEGIMIDVAKNAKLQKISNNVHTIMIEAGDWYNDHTEYDEVLLNNVIAVIWEEVFNLLEFYYKNHTDNTGSYKRYTTESK